MVDLRRGLALTVNAILEMESPPAGSTSIVSQSGTMLGTVLSRERDDAKYDELEVRSLTGAGAH